MRIAIAFVLILVCCGAAHARIEVTTYSGAMVQLDKPQPTLAPPAPPAPPAQGVLQVRPVIEAQRHWLFHNLFKLKTRWVIEPVFRIQE